MGCLLILDKKQKADALNSYFASVHSVHPVVDALPRVTDLISPELTFSHEAVLRNLPSKLFTTPESVPPLFYKKLSGALAEPLHLLFTLSYEDSEEPDLFRCSLVTPVHKKGSRKQLENYRPIAQEVIPCIVMLA